MNSGQFKHYCIALLGCLVTTLALPDGISAVRAQSQCEGDAYVHETFDNGASWELCWDSLVRENLVLRDVRYTPPQGEPIPVLASARLAQLHVAYDDGDVTYNDITEYGLGGGYLTTLTQQDCPNGNLLQSQGSAILCLTLAEGNDSYRTANRSVNAQSFNLFSVSQVGAYAYIASWTFYANGAIQPAVGATGALQRSSSLQGSSFGRVLQGDPQTIWISHTHNYYWRLDFDLGVSATDDTVTESRYILDQDGRRAVQVETFRTEQARTVNPDQLQSWQIWDSAVSDLASTTTFGYLLEPVRSGHRLVRRASEPFTAYDFFVTVANDCERFASQNARFNPDCLNDVLQYSDGESLLGQDLVIWHRVSFHHVPRSEDQRNMHTHWDDFVLEPINVANLSGEFNDVINLPPIIDPLANQSHRVGGNVDVLVQASDPDNDILTFVATGLPPGIEFNAAGRLIGVPLIEGQFDVNLLISDDQATAESTFTWQIGDQQTARRSGTVGVNTLLVLMLFSLVISPIASRYNHHRI